MTTWYYVRNPDLPNTIEEVEVVKETRYTLTVILRWEVFGKEHAQERRTDKVSTWGCYFPTFDEALTYLLNRCEERVSLAKQNLDLAERNRERVIETYVRKEN